MVFEKSNGVFDIWRGACFIPPRSLAPHQLCRSQGTVKATPLPVAPVDRDLIPARGRQTDRKTTGRGRAGIQPNHVEKMKCVLVLLIIKYGAKMSAECRLSDPPRYGRSTYILVRPGEMIALACRPPVRNGSDLGVPEPCLPRPARRPEQSYARRVLPDFPPFLLLLLPFPHGT